ncbi:MAG: hypothetical protein AAF242_12630 [Bacteroidota bacterium]
MEVNPYQRIELIFYSLAAGQIIFAVITYFFLLDEGNKSDIPQLLYVVPLALIACMGAAYFMNNKLREAAPDQKDETAKLSHYQTRVIMRSALMEGANLLAIIAALITGDVTFFFVFLIGFAVFFYFRPSRYELEHDYQLMV